MNKMFKKIVATTATLAIAATMCVSAFAAGETATHTTGAVKVDGYAAVTDATQYTVMIFGAGFETTGSDGKVTYNPAEIYYINQGTKLYAADENDTAGLLDNMLVKLAEGETSLADGTYTVRIGNDKGTVVNVPLTVSTVVKPETTTLIFGDVNGDGSATSADATYIAAFFTGGAANVGAIYNIGATIGDTGLVFGDVNGDGSATSADATYIAAFFTGGAANVGATYDIGAEYTVPVVK